MLILKLLVTSSVILGLVSCSNTKDTRAEPGMPGEKGDDGKDGVNGKDGVKGEDGISGKDGVVVFETKELASGSL